MTVISVTVRNTNVKLEVPMIVKSLKKMFHNQGFGEPCKKNRPFICPW